MVSTNEQYDGEAKICRTIFIKKTQDYGTSWRVLRMISIADQLYIKAKRIRTLQEMKETLVGDDKAGEFRAMVNYGVIGLIQGSIGPEAADELSVTEAGGWYDEKIALARGTMLAKNHDYGEAWRDMSQESFADLILMKLLRVRQILSNDGKTLISEGVDSNFIDIINYSLFALILIAEGKHTS
jgi:Nucleotide modification associated domain 1